MSLLACGIGGIAIGLPLLEEMLATGAGAATAAQKAVPVRSFNLFFGLGIPPPLQKEGYDGVLEPLKPLADKLLIMRDVDQVRCDQSGINAHFDGASGAFTATPPDGEAKSGGASIDQVIRRSQYPDGLPAGMVPTLVGGTFFPFSRFYEVHVQRANAGALLGAFLGRRTGELVLGGDRVEAVVVPLGVAEVGEHGPAKVVVAGALVEGDELVDGLAFAPGVAVLLLAGGEG